MLVDAEINAQECIRMVHLARQIRANEERNRNASLALLGKYWVVGELDRLF